MVASSPPRRAAASSWIRRWNCCPPITGAGGCCPRPESSDSEFTWENFQVSVNKDLADVLGNFISRVTKFCRSKFSEEVPAGGSFGPAEHALIAELTTRIRAYEGHMEAMEVRKSASELRAIWVAGNEYLQSTAPWTHDQGRPRRCRRPDPAALNLIRLYAVLSAPFIPDAAANMMSSMNTLGYVMADDVEAALTAPARRPRLHGPRGALRQNHRRRARRLASPLLWHPRLSA